MPNQWGRGSYGQRGSAVAEVLAEMAEKARLREEQERQANLQKQRMEHETALGNRDIEARYYAELIRNAKDPRAWEIAKAQGLNVPEFRQLPAEQVADVAAKAGLDYYGDPSKWSPGFGAMNAFQSGTGAALPQVGQVAAVQQDVYTRPNIPPQMVEATDIGSGRRMTAKEREDIRLDTSRTAAQNAASYASAKAANAAADATRAAVPAQPSGPVVMGGPVPGQPTGEAYLQTLDPLTASLVKGIANYTVDLTKVSSQRGGSKGAASERNRLAQMVIQYDPTYDMTQYASRAATRTDFTKGKAANNIRSLNTAIKHIGSLAEAAEKLKNFDTPALNWIGNTVQTQTGDKRVVQFNMAANAVESEMASLFKGTGATDQEIKAWRDNLSPSMSPEQLEGAVAMAVELMSGRLAALSSQWQSTMGKPRDFVVLNEQSKKTLQKLGIDPEALDTGITAGGAAGTPGATDPAVKAVADKFFGGNVAQAEEYLRNKGALK